MLRDAASQAGCFGLLRHYTAADTQQSAEPSAHLSWPTVCLCRLVSETYLTRQAAATHGAYLLLCAACSRHLAAEDPCSPQGQLER